ncbi:MAG: Fic family protein [Dokdonia sp.]|jgi:Fic family protein
MLLLPIPIPTIDPLKIKQIDIEIRAIYRLITFSRKHEADDLLDSFLSSTQNLKELLSIKNAQMEAQSEEEAAAYVINLNKALYFITDEINANKTFTNQLQLFQLFRLTSPESHELHPNKYRNTDVQIGSILCPEPKQVPSLVNELFHKLSFIENPILRAIYFHHELIRIHPFSDGNGRTTRIAKNWMLMYDLYPPIFIRDEEEKKEYITTLSASFNALHKDPNHWGVHTINFFKQEIHRIYSNTNLMYNKIHQMGHLNQKES